MSLESVREAAAERVGADAGYAGDVTPEEAWHLLKEDPAAVLVDVRTQPEWAFVGIPDLSEAGKQPVLVSWQMFPAMNVNPNFAAELATRGVTADRSVIFICRSGNRSADAARAMTAKGFTRCFNLAEGFEGSLDGERHRGTAGGWKAKGLPWVQG
ncbi:MAG: rhodanese-like domain-containing protein [Alphaproteobacteria bacterium]